MISKDKGFQSESLVSFVLVSYNQEKFIREAVEGALSQSYSPLEIILSDDCSTDNTFEIMREMAAAYSGPHRIILNKNLRNLGIGGHLNDVFSKCSGQLIVVAAGDDISLSERVASLYQSWINHGKPSMVLSRWESIDQDGNCLAPNISGSNESSFGLLGSGQNNLRVVQDYLNGKPFSFVGATAAYSQDLIHNFPALDEDVVSEDFLLCLRSLLASGVLYVEDVLVLYRQHDKNISKVEGSGSERFRVWSIRHASTFSCFYKDLKHLFSLRLLSLVDFARLGIQARLWVKSASLLERWNHASFLTKFFWLFPSLMLCGSRRHKKFAINNIFSAQR